MSQIFSWLKYLPAILCDLLVVAWVASWFFGMGFIFPQGTRQIEILIGGGSIVVWETQGEVYPNGFWRKALEKPNSEWRDRLGQFRRSGWDSIYGYAVTSFPVPALVTLLLPLAIGCLNRFRFPLWSWFASTGLIAAELAFYLR